LVNQKTQEIICVAVREGKVHDFRIWKESQIGIGKKTELLADNRELKIFTITAELPSKRLRKSL
jgi:hypothetical protein